MEKNGKMNKKELLNDTIVLEKSFLGGLLLINEEEKSELFLKVKFDNFSTIIHQEIYKVLQTLFEDKKNFEPSLIMKMVLQNNKKLKAEALNESFSEILDEISSFGLSEKADQIIERAKFRKIDEVLKKITTLSNDVSLTPEDVIEQAIELFDNAIKGNSNTKLINLRDYMIENIKKDDEDDRVRDTNIKMGYKTGFSEFDNKLNGLNKSDLIIIAGRPAMGKTAFALNVLMNFCKENSKDNNKVRAIFISLEMGMKQLYTRILAMESEVNAQKIARRELTEEDYGKFSIGYANIYNSEVMVLDNPNVNMSDLRNIAIKEQKNNGLDFIIIDYLQLISSTNKINKSRQEEVSEISRKLKQLARELNIPVIALSQLSRSVENRADKRPLLSDLRESGAIEQDADVVVFLYRDEYYNPTTSDLGTAEVIIAKHRNGSVGTVKLKFEPELTKFSNIITF